MNTKSIVAEFRSLPTNQKVETVIAMKQIVKEELERNINDYRDKLNAVISDVAAAPESPIIVAEKKTRPVKYRDPETGETWSGAGRVANWIIEREKRGHRREEYLVR